MININKKSKNNIKLLSLLFSLLLILLSCETSFSTFAKEIESSDLTPTSIIYEKDVENYKATYEDINGNEYINEIINANPESNYLPSTYDNRECGFVTPVRDQGSYGFCWSFGSTAAIESNMLKNKTTDKSADDLHISEVSQGVMFMTQSLDTESIFHYDYLYNEKKGSQGGWPEYVAKSFADGVGVHNSEHLPYSDFSKGYSDELRYYSLSRFKDYEDYSLSYGVNDVVLKEKIINNGGAALYMTTSGFWQDHKTYYYDNGVVVERGDNHVVEVIGWDDNIDKSLFNPDDKENQPKHNGAWICKNSWTALEHDNGFFYLSYDSLSLSFYTFETQNKDAYDNIYQYSTTATNYVEGNLACIYQAKNNETLEQIGFMNFGKTNGKIEIYKLKNDYKSPLDGILIEEQDFSYDVTGIHSIETKSKIEFSKGDSFSIVIFANSGMIANSSTIDNTLKKENVGFFSKDGINFTDVLSLDSELKMSYPYIKAYTKIEGETDKEKLLTAIEEYKTADTSLCKDKELVKKYDEEAKKAINMIESFDITQTEINNQSYILNFYHSICALIYQINNKEDFMTYYYNNKAKIKTPEMVSLNCDLDLKGFEIDNSLTYLKTFSGIFLGNSHTISNLTINHNHNDSDLSFGSGLFGTIDNAIIKDLNINNFTVTSDVSFSALAGNIKNNSTISNCSVENSLLVTDGHASGGGAISGIIEGTNNKIENCFSKNNDIRTYRNSGGIVGELFRESENNFINNKAENNKLISIYSISKTYPKDPNSFTLLLQETSKERTYCESLIIAENDKILIDECTGKIDNITNANLIDNKWQVIEDESYKVCDITYSENYAGIFVTKYNFIDNTIQLTNIATDTPIESFVAPNKIGKISVSSISQSLFENHSLENVKTIVIEDGIAVNDVVFSNFKCLESIKFGEGTTYIKPIAFEGLKQLKEVTFPNSLKETQNGAFNNCTSLEKINFGNGIKNIGRSSFNGCTSLKEITIPDSVEEIGEYAFSGCLFLKIKLGKNINKLSLKSLGYLNNFITYPDHSDNIKIVSFVINGYTESAKEYAQENGFKYVDLNKEKPDFDDSIFDISILKRGDSDLDREITIIDAKTIQKYIAHIINANDYQLYNMRVKDYYDEITILNATQIQKYLAHIIDTLDY